MDPNNKPSVLFLFLSPFTLKVGSVLDQKPLLQSLFCTGVDCFLTISVIFLFFQDFAPNCLSQSVDW